MESIKGLERDLHKKLKRLRRKTIRRAISGIGLIIVVYIGLLYWANIYFDKLLGTHNIDFESLFSTNTGNVKPIFYSIMVATLAIVPMIIFFLVIVLKKNKKKKKEIQNYFRFKETNMYIKMHEIDHPARVKKFGLSFITEPVKCPNNFKYVYVWCDEEHLHIADNLKELKNHEIIEFSKIEYIKMKSNIVRKKTETKIVYNSIIANILEYFSKPMIKTETYGCKYVKIAVIDGLTYHFDLSFHRMILSKLQAE